VVIKSNKGIAIERDREAAERVGVVDKASVKCDRHGNIDCTRLGALDARLYLGQRLERGCFGVFAEQSFSSASGCNSLVSLQCASFRVFRATASSRNCCNAHFRDCIVCCLLFEA